MKESIVVALLLLFLAPGRAVFPAQERAGETGAQLSAVKWRILSVQAHPDDEIVWAGTLARYKAERGSDIKITLVCASARQGLPEGAAEDTRIKELECSVQALGIDDLRFLDLLHKDFTDMLGLGADQVPGPNPKLWNSMREKLVGLLFPLPPRAEAHPNKCPLSRLESRLTALIREVRPHAVITWEPGGTTIHPEHMIVSHATTAAFFAAANPDYPGVTERPYEPLKLYYAGVHPLFRPDDPRMDALIGNERQGIVLGRARFGIGMPPVTLVLDVSNWMAQKQKAAGCHVSQGFPQRMASGMRSQVMQAGPHETTELFYLAVSRVEGQADVERSLLDGIRPEG